MKFEKAVVDRVLANYTLPTILDSLGAEKAADSIGDRSARDLLMLNWSAKSTREHTCGKFGVDEDEIRAASMILCEKTPLWSYACLVSEFYEQAGRLAWRLKSGPEPEHGSDIPQGYEGGW